MPIFQPFAFRAPQGGLAGPVVTTNMMFYVDASDATSYSGTGTSWNDISGNGFVFTLNSATPFTSNGEASYFNWDNNTDTGARLNTGQGFSPQPGTNGGYHFSAFIYKTKWGSGTGGSQYQNIARYSQVGNRLLFAFQNYDTYHTVGVETTSFSEMDVGVVSGDYLNKWVYVSANFDDANNLQQLYRNGSLVQQQTKTGSVPNDTNTSFDIGWWNVGERLSARFALCHFHDTSLSSTDISDNFNAMKSRFGL